MLQIKSLVSDITYVATLEGWLYLAVILDLFSRRVVGWKLGESLEAKLLVTALRNALVLRRRGGSQERWNRVLDRCRVPGGFAAISAASFALATNYSMLICHTAPTLHCAESRLAVFRPNSFNVCT